MNYSTYRKTRELDCLIAKEIYGIDSSWDELPMFVPGIGETARATPWYSWGSGGFSQVEFYHSNNKQALKLVAWLETKLGPVEVLFSEGRVFVRAGHARPVVYRTYTSDQPTLPEAVCEIVINYLTDQKKSV